MNGNIFSIKLLTTDVRYRHSYFSEKWDNADNLTIIVVISGASENPLTPPVEQTKTAVGLLSISC